MIQISTSPWGYIHHCKTVVDGVYIVETASHGGIMIHKDIAEQLLSKYARAKGSRFQDYYCYEEDCDYAIPVFEMKHFWQKFFRNKDNSEIENILMKSLSLWNADYLIAIGVTPLEKQYKQYLANKKEEEMRRNKDENLIIAAWGDWHTKRKGINLVLTADGKYHYVTEKSYKPFDGLYLLSNCEIVESDVPYSA